MLLLRNKTRALATGRDPPAATKALKKRIRALGFYTTPWSIIESATFTNPAMFAPIT
jgi:hypothetical protein